VTVGPANVVNTCRVLISTPWSFSTAIRIPSNILLMASAGIAIRTTTALTRLLGLEEDLLDLVEAFLVRNELIRAL